MMPCTRPPAPEVLKAARDAWLQALAKDRDREFRWPERAGETLNKHLLPVLLAMTSQRCAYCDGYAEDRRAGSRETIDHFKPKSRFPEAALDWDNLFPACGGCQGSDGKGSDWDERVLKPDVPGFQFERFFLYEDGTGLVLANPAASLEDQVRANATIAFFGLNLKGLPEARRRHVRLYGAEPEAERPYRFAYPPP